MIEEPKAEYRAGIGTDIHRVAEGRRLMLCGVHVAYPAGLAGHSDGDVGLHAVIDALLGAAGMGGRRNGRHRNVLSRYRPALEGCRQ
ncbi:MAG: 2-C-methyl-D-erythritol 2,4-cyclodiphosphate synthase [Planctomycetota bacterium]